MQGRLVHSHTTELEKHIELGSEISTNSFTKVTQRPIYCSLLLLPAQWESVHMAVLMEISKQGHTCHKSCFSCSKNICGSCWLGRRRPLLVLPVPCTYSSQGARGNTLLNLLSATLESKIITANFPLGHPLQTTKDSEDTQSSPSLLGNATHWKTIVYHSIKVQHEVNEINEVADSTGIVCWAQAL